MDRLDAFLEAAEKTYRPPQKPKPQEKFEITLWLSHTEASMLYTLAGTRALGAKRKILKKGLLLMWSEYQKELAKL